MTIRAFFALPLKSQVVRRLRDHADSLCHLDPRADVLWVDSDNYHLTLCFLGEIEIKQVDGLEREATKALSSQNSFQVHLQQFEHYNVNDNLAVIAAIGNLSDELASLRLKLVELLEKAGINAHQQNFKPHVTLGRMAVDALFQANDEWPDLDLLTIADSVVLYQSKAGSSGPIYAPLFEISLVSEAAIN